MPPSSASRPMSTRPPKASSRTTDRPLNRPPPKPPPPPKPESPAEAGAKSTEAPVIEAHRADLVEVEHPPTTHHPHPDPPRSCGHRAAQGHRGGRLQANEG